MQKNNHVLCCIALCECLADNFFLFSFYSSNSNFPSLRSVASNLSTNSQPPPRNPAPVNSNKGRNKEEVGIQLVLSLPVCHYPVSIYEHMFTYQSRRVLVRIHKHRLNVTHGLDLDHRFKVASGRETMPRLNVVD